MTWLKMKVRNVEFLIVVSIVNCSVNRNCSEFWCLYISIFFKVFIVWLIPASRYSWRLWYYRERKSCIICSNRCFNWYEIYVCVVLSIFWSTKSLWWSPCKRHSWLDDKVIFFSEEKSHYKLWSTRNHEHPA